MALLQCLCGPIALLTLCAPIGPCTGTHLHLIPVAVRGAAAAVGEYTSVRAGGDSREQARQKGGGAAAKPGRGELGTQEGSVPCCLHGPSLLTPHACMRACMRASQGTGKAARGAALSSRHCRQKALQLQPCSVCKAGCCRRCIYGGRTAMCCKRPHWWCEGRSCCGRRSGLCTACAVAVCSCLCC